MDCYEYALQQTHLGRAVAVIPGVDEYGEPCVMVPELQPEGWGAIAAYHPHQPTRAGFLTGVIIGLRRYCEQEEGFKPGPVQADA